MWKKWKESEFFRKLKQVRVNRAVYLSSIVILLTLAVVLTITAVTNRAKKGNVDDPIENTTVRVPDVTLGTNVQDAPTLTPDNSIPELSLPVEGRLNKGHSVDVQVFSQTMQDYRVHLGIDVTTAAGAPVCAVADGTVSQIWEDPMMGWCVAVTHKGDCVTVYKNLAKDLAEGMNTGIEVKRGQLLGYVGDTAILEIAEEPHLHMEMTVGGLQVDPLDYFSESVLATLSQDTSYEENANEDSGK